MGKQHYSYNKVNIPDLDITGIGAETKKSSNPPFFSPVRIVLVATLS